jgi:hypothetical protein
MGQKMIVDTIAEQMLFCTVRIEASNDQIESVGTGFLFAYNLPDGREVPLLITNRHVVEGYNTGKIRFTLMKDGVAILGEYIEKSFSTFSTKWFFHPNKEIDIAVLPLGLHIRDIIESDKKVFTVGIPKEAIPSTEQIKELDAIEDIVFVGYPNGLWDSTNNLPIIRRGITATPISIDFEGKPIFLVDASVFQGSSGSPVFLYNKGTIADRHGNIKIGSRLLLLGIISSVYYKEDEKILDMVSSKKVPSVITSEMLDIGIVYKSNQILQMIESILRALKII